MPAGVYSHRRSLSAKTTSRTPCPSRKSNPALARSPFAVSLRQGADVFLPALVCRKDTAFLRIIGATQYSFKFLRRRRLSSFFIWRGQGLSLCYLDYRHPLSIFKKPAFHQPEINFRFLQEFRRADDKICQHTAKDKRWFRPCGFWSYMISQGRQLIRKKHFETFF